MSVIQGVRGAGNGLAANQKADVWKSLMLLKPYATPMMQKLFMGNKPAKVVVNPQGRFDWMEDTFLQHHTEVKSAITHSGATLELTTSNVNEIDFFNVDDLILVEKNDEMFYVSSVTDTTVTITRVDGSTASDVSSGNITVITSVRSEDAEQRTAYDTVESNLYNYLTIMDATVSMTRRTIAGEHYTDGLSFPEKLSKKQEEMKLQFERLAFLSTSAGTITQANSLVKSYGRGALGTLTTNVTDYGSALTEASLDTFIKNITKKGSVVRDFYLGSDLYYDVQDIIKAKIGSLPQMVKGSYGVEVARYHYGPARINLILNPILDGKFAEYGFALDPDKVVGRYMNNDDIGSRKFRIEMDTQKRGADYRSAKLLMDVGIQIMNESTGGILYT